MPSRRALGKLPEFGASAFPRRRRTATFQGEFTTKLSAFDARFAMSSLSPRNLKISVMIRVLLGALACAFAAASFVLIESNRDATRALEAKTNMIASNLEMQLLRIAANLDTTSRFPDWEFLADQCSRRGCASSSRMRRGIACARAAWARRAMRMPCRRGSSAPIAPFSGLRGRSNATSLRAANRSEGYAHDRSERKRIARLAGCDAHFCR